LKYKKYIKGFVNKCLVPFFRNSTLTADDFLYPLCKSAATKSYVESCGDKADSLHRRIEQCYEESFLHAFTACILPFLKRYRYHPVTLAFDITDEPFYGKTSNMWIHGWTGEKGIKGKFKYLVVSMVGEEKHPLLALPFHCGQNMTHAVEVLMNILTQHLPYIQLVLFDRGFYAGELLSYLQEKKITYLLFVPKNKKMKEYWEDDPDAVHHVIRYAIGNTKQAVTVRHCFMNYDKKQWTFATNMKVRKAEHLIRAYKQRWQIETNFRVQDEARIKSKSCHYLTRYFYFLISLFLQFLWKIFGTKQFIAFVTGLYEYFFLKSLGIVYVQPS
jgi:hypothetical protein